MYYKRLETARMGAGRSHRTAEIIHGRGCNTSENAEKQAISRGIKR
jgi:hypothetical protein